MYKVIWILDKLFLKYERKVKLTLPSPSTKKCSKDPSLIRFNSDLTKTWRNVVRSLKIQLPVAFCISIVLGYAEVPYLFFRISVIISLAAVMTILSASFFFFLPFFLQIVKIIIYQTLKAHNVWFSISLSKV